ncbi:TetR/AcrR family transcriptional regulator [Pedobacter sp. MC2016-14]|uniref:TetR/AcrR family transcriptional regulator n=1 Tax=Pedobacter sp. MC2016-14 TaxID=2897327 RepID=UPI001E49BDB0|nr:TetR/AcrR family transcriptional regulator [Pedobacter sp. MC2016-14]MCD0487337.1 TetR/AcrR family transcriptional regulator [Pedobacter sp. MC2016-14]
MNKEKTDKRTSILIAAEKLFSELGYEGTSTRQIARESSANMAMINYYFGSKDGVFQEIISQRMVDFNAQLVTISEDKITSFEKLKRVVEGYANRILSNISFHKMMQRELSLAQRPEVFCKVKDVMFSNLQLIENIVNEGIASGSFRKVDVRMLIATIMGTISSVAISPSKITSGSKLDINIPEDREILTTRLLLHLDDLIKTYLTPQK